MSKRARYSSVDGPTRLRRATSVAERVGALPPHLLRAPRRNLFFPAEFILTMPVLADDSLERARFHALLDEARRCRVCVGLLPFEPARRSEEHTSELQSLMRISYAGSCLNKKKQ